MTDLTVKELKENLQNVIDVLDSYDDDEIIQTVGNTYFINSRFYAQVYGYGFVDLENIEAKIGESEGV